MKKVTKTDKVLEGVNQYCDIIKLTLGPTGHNVIIDSEYGKPIITNDGYTISEAFNIKDKEMRAGAEYAKYGADKTNEEAGDGRSTYAVLLQSILNGGREVLENTVGIDSIKLRKEIIEAKDELISKLNPKPCTDSYEVAKTSAKSEDIGKMVADIYNKIGTDGVVKIEDSESWDDEVSIVEGVELDEGYEPMELKDASIVLINDKLESIADVKQILDERFAKDESNVLLIANEYSHPVVKFIKMANGDAMKVAAIKSPGFANARQAMFEDLEAITGGKINGEPGKCPRVTVDEEKTILIGLDTKARVKEVEALNPVSEYDKELKEERIAKLKGSIAIIKVGAQTKGEQVEKKHHLKDAIKAAKSALDGGTVKGGGLALLEASELINDETNGAKVLKKAAKAPYEQINLNGFKFKDTEVVDSFIGVKSSLENAVSVATSLLTTGAGLIEVEDD